MDWNAHCNHAQLQTMVDVMSLNPELVSGKLTTNFRRENLKKKWEALATLLNSEDLGPGKDAVKWRKIWKDQKLRIRCKAARIKRKQGGEPSSRETLSDLEKLVLRMMGPITATSDSEMDDNDNSDIQAVAELNNIPVLTIDDSDTELNQTKSNDSSELNQTKSNDSTLTPSKRRKLFNENMSDLKESFKAVHHQIELQTAALREQTSIIQDIAKSLQVIAEAIEDR